MEENHLEKYNKFHISFCYKCWSLLFILFCVLLTHFNYLIMFFLYIAALHTNCEENPALQFFKLSFWSFWIEKTDNIYTI